MGWPAPFACLPPRRAPLLLRTAARFTYGASNPMRNAGGSTEAVFTSARAEGGQAGFWSRPDRGSRGGDSGSMSGFLGEIVRLKPELLGSVTARGGLHYCTDAGNTSESATLRHGLTRVAGVQGRGNRSATRSGAGRSEFACGLSACSTTSWRWAHRTDTVRRGFCSLSLAEVGSAGFWCPSLLRRVAVRTGWEAVTGARREYAAQLPPYVER